MPREASAQAVDSPPRYTNLERVGHPKLLKMAMSYDLLKPSLDALESKPVLDWQMASDVMDIYWSPSCLSMQRDGIPMAPVVQS
jgi:hypothetical protein